MKKITKIGLIIFLVGLVLSISFATIFSVNINNALKITNSSPFINLETSVNDQTISKEYQNVDNIIINVALGEVVVEKGAKYTLNIDYCSKCQMNFSETIENGTLVVKASGPHGLGKLNPSHPLIKITIPDHKKLNELKITNDWGTIRVSKLDVERLNLNASAGDVLVADSRIDEASIVAKMGSVNISSNIETLALNLAMGEATFNGQIANLDVENEVGATSITVLNAYLEEYEVMLASNMGSISVDGDERSGLDNAIHLNSDKNLSKSISVNNEMGDVKLSFVQ